MTTFPAVPSTASDLPANEFEVGYVAEDGTRHQMLLADAAAVQFEAMAPARRFSPRKGQRHLPGRWWSATDGRHVGYESWLERDHLVWLDWDRDHRLRPAHVRGGFADGERARERQVFEYRPGCARQLAAGPVPPVKRQVDGAEQVGEPFGPGSCVGHATRVAAG